MNEEYEEEIDDEAIAEYEEQFNYEESYYDMWFCYPGQNFPCREVPA
jgi:hypothetical protein